MFNKYLFQFLVIASFIFMSSCEIINPVEKAPSYIRVDSVKVVSDYGSQGSNSHNITDIWHYVNNEILGAFRIPSTIPSLITGNVELNTQAGIKLNGVTDTRVPYPFYNAYIDRIELTPEKIILVYPVFTYASFAEFAWIEDFESAGISLEKTLTSDTTINEISSSDEIFRNTQDLSEINRYSGLVHLYGPYKTFDIQTIDKFILPKNGNYVFLELNYKVSTETIVGLISNYQNSINKKPIVVLNPTTTWKKIYINLTLAVSREINAQDFQIYFAAGRKETSSEDKFYFDNIKLIHTKIQ